MGLLGYYKNEEQSHTPHQESLHIYFLYQKCAFICANPSSITGVVPMRKKDIIIDQHNGQ